MVELAYIYISLPVKFSKGKHGHIQPTAVIPVKLVCLADDRLGVVSYAKISARGGNTAYDPLFQGQVDTGLAAALLQHLAHSGGHPKSQIDYITSF